MPEVIASAPVVCLVLKEQALTEANKFELLMYGSFVPEQYQAIDYNSGLIHSEYLHFL